MSCCCPKKPRKGDPDGETTSLNRAEQREQRQRMLDAADKRQGEQLTRGLSKGKSSKPSAYAMSDRVSKDDVPNSASKASYYN